MGVWGWEQGGARGTRLLVGRVQGWEGRLSQTGTRPPLHAVSGRRLGRAPGQQAMCALGNARGGAGPTPHAAGRAGRGSGGRQVGSPVGEADGIEVLPAPVAVPDVDALQGAGASALAAQGGLAAPAACKVPPGRPACSPGMPVHPTASGQSFWGLLRCRSTTAVHRRLPGSCRLRPLTLSCSTLALVQPATNHNNSSATPALQGEGEARGGRIGAVNAGGRGRRGGQPTSQGKGKAGRHMQLGG